MLAIMNILLPYISYIGYYVLSIWYKKKTMISMTPLGSRGNPWRLRWLQPLRVTAAIAQGFLRLAEGLGLGCDD